MTVMAASPFLTRTCVTDPLALDVLSSLDQPVGPLEPLSRWKALEVLRVAALDLSDGSRSRPWAMLLADLADGVLGVGRQRPAASPANWPWWPWASWAHASSTTAAISTWSWSAEATRRALSRLARQAWRIDLALRPEGRSGPLVRSLASYTAYWDRWAQTWEFQALLKARAAAGRPDLGRDFVEEASRRVWSRPLGADELRSLRAMKGRAEQRWPARASLSAR